jgi:Astacin (Peptidase family M12A)
VWEIDLGERKLILKAMQNIERYTCVTFQPKKSGQRDGYVYITGFPMGCFSAVGYQKQEQLLNLQHGACVNEVRIFQPSLNHS